MKVINHPYPHIKQFDFLTGLKPKKLSGCIEKLGWEFYDKGGYKYSVSSIDYESECYLQNKTIIHEFISGNFISGLADALSVKLNRCNDFTFHKMDAGDFSSKHTDKNNFGELARVIYYLSEPASYEGGSLKLFDADGRNVYEVLKMPANSILCFRLTDDFFHEVEKITKGTRYCISITYS